MKAIQLFFEMLVQYQHIKTELKIKYEQAKLETRLAYEEYMKKLHNM